ncbi:MAG: response regulator transcription factor [Thiovulaceae bacterium]|nr:response regulator transcription factor [Sulfurimonadaceae bacterium]
MTQLLLCSQSDALIKRWKAIFKDHSLAITISDSLASHYYPEQATLALVDIMTVPLDLNTEFKNSQLKIFALTGTTHNDEGLRLLQKGVSGYGNSFLSKENLLQAFNIIKSGNVWLYPELMQHLISQTTTQVQEIKVDLSILTSKEEQTAMLVAKGLSNKEIALKMSITDRTVKAHLSAIYQKLSIKDRLCLALAIKGHNA